MPLHLSRELCIGGDQVHAPGHKAGVLWKGVHSRHTDVAVPEVQDGGIQCRSAAHPEDGMDLLLQQCWEKLRFQRLPKKCGLSTCRYSTVMRGCGQTMTS